MKLWPPYSAAMPNERALTPSQWQWCQYQLALDDGLDVCTTCEALGYGPYCHACGHLLHPEEQTCDICGMRALGTHCQHCGGLLRSVVADAIAAQTFDWDSWAASLRPFLGGLTTREQALLRGER